MAELLHEIAVRRAHRALDEKPIPADVMQRIMTAATYAPSCFNNQPWRFMALTESETLEQAKATLPDANYWAKKSPCLVLVITKSDLDCQLKGGREYAHFDVGLATANLMLQAAKEGIIAHPIAGFSPSKLKTAFEIPDEFRVVTVVVLGYPGDASHLNEKHQELERSERTRKPEAEVISYNRWFQV